MEFSKIRYIIFFSFLAGVSLLFLMLLRPFIYPLFWAAVIATLFYPLYNRLLVRLKSANLSALITLVAVFLIIIIPLAIMGTILVSESISVYNSLNSGGGLIESTRQAITIIKEKTAFSQLNIDEQLVTERLTEIARTGLNFTITSLKDFTQNSIVFFVMFIIMMYSLFFFLRDGEKMLKKIMHLCPLSDKNERLLYQKFTLTTKATLKGTLIIGTIQGILGCLVFWLVGINNAVIWGLLMLVLSLIPGLGAAIVYLPAGLILLATGGVWQGIVVLFIGLVVISTSDNLLRPILVGKDVHIHPLLIFFSTLGGIAVFGASGFVIGPVITSLLLAFWEIYEHYYRIDLNHNS